jgi:hypothetical protein
MIRSKTTVLDAKSTPLIANDTIKIKAASFVFENNWISFDGTLFSVTEYIASVVVSPRTRFFTNRNYAVCIVVGLTKDGEVAVIEGPQIDFNKQTIVPVPSTFNILPIVGIVLYQDGTTDLINGFKPLTDINIIFFSGMGNVIDKNKPGALGPDSNDFGNTGVQGFTGNVGFSGITGQIGITGQVGRKVFGDQGETGLRGMTGICWSIHIPFQNFV